MSEPSQPPALAPTAERRDAVIARLSEYFAAGRIELEELEARIERAVGAPTVAALDAVLADLEGAVAPRAAPAAAPPAPMGPDRPKSSGLTVAVLSGTERRGRWFPSRRHVGIAFMGGAKLDFREAELEPGLTEVSLWVLCGGVNVIVPPDVDLEVDGWAIMGGLGGRASHPGPLEQQRKRLRVHARVCMGGVEVKVRPRREPEPDEHLPRRSERKRLR